MWIASLLLMGVLQTQHHQCWIDSVACFDCFWCKKITSKPVGFMQSCSRWLPLAWVAEFHAVLHLASHTCCLHIVHMWMSSTCRCRLHMHIVCMHMLSTCHPHLHIIRTHTCHPHIICSTPHGQHGPKLSFYSDRIWLLNRFVTRMLSCFISGSYKWFVR